MLPPYFTSASRQDASSGTNGIPYRFNGRTPSQSNPAARMKGALPSVRGSETMFRQSGIRPFSAAGTLCGDREGRTLLFTAFVAMGAIIARLLRNVNTFFVGGIWMGWAAGGCG